jgi:diguanylate cyclase
MTFFVLTIALANVALGFALALWLAREKRPEDELEIISALGPQDPREVMQRHTPLPPTAATGFASLPTAWLSLIDTIAKRNPLVAAASGVLKLEFAEYRDELIAIDTAVRCHRHGTADRPIGEVFEQLKEINARWNDQKWQSLEQLQENDQSAGELSRLQGELEMVLEEQAAQIETVTANLAALDLAADVSDGCQQLLGEVGKLLAMVHNVRDAIHEAVTLIFAHEKQLDSIQQKILVDPLSGLYCRTGLEAVTWEWWQEDPTRQRQVSIAMIDVDHFADVNERLGPIAGDQVLFALAQLLREAIRDERGYDVATRYSGQRFVLFFGDTGPRNAVTAMQRIRRIVEESQVQLGETKVRLTISAGVTPIMQSDTTDTLLARAAGALGEAKQAGRNCTRVDEGGGPCEMEAPELNVSGRTVLLEV